MLMAAANPAEYQRRAVMQALNRHVVWKFDRSRREERTTLTTPADAPDLSIERDIFRMALRGNVRGAASPGLMMRRKRRRPGQARIRCQGRRIGRVCRPRSTVPMAVRMAK